MERNVILGISNLDVRSHDNAACLLRDGMLVAQVEEERFSRKKHAYDSLPTAAIRHCLEAAHLSPDDIDAIAIGWNLPKTSFDKNATPALVGDDEEIARRLLGPSLHSDALPIHFVPHHLAHASVPYYASGFHSAAILVVDGAGETEATTHWHGKETSISPLLSREQDSDSLGFMYEGVSEYLGFEGSEAGKVMGLAAFHDQNVVPFEAMRIEEDGYRINFPSSIREETLHDFEEQGNYLVMDLIKQYWIRYCESLFGPRRQFKSRAMNVGDALFREKSRIAAILQTSLEQALLSSVHALREKTGEENLCISGGVALNCTANGALERSGIFKNTYIYPASNDAGVALGAALQVLHERRFAPFENKHISETPYWGPEYSDAEIEATLCSLGVQYLPCKEDFSDVAELLSHGDVVAWFQGRMEIGPRALGARSILADPRKVAMRDKVNKIKERELWRPLAPSVLQGYESDYFDPNVSSPFMLRAATVKAEKRAIIPAVVHVDHSSRYQSVIRDTNPRYWQLIESFRRITGVPMVLNTSFNHKEPIVCSPIDALKTFSERAIDHLAIGQFLISKPSPILHGNIHEA